MAVVKGLRIVRGKLGDTGFRQQYVKENNGNYRKRTVAFQLPEGNSSNTALQSRQRSKFKMVQALGTLLAREGMTKSFYRSVIGISGYNAFIQDNLASAVVETSDGTPYVSFPDLKVTNGDFFKKILPFQSDLTPGTDYNPDCECAVKLVWEYSYVNDQNADNYVVALIGLKINEDGAAEEAILVQPLHKMTECSAEIILPKCDCCKTYWYAFFINPYNGYFTTSVYIGTCLTEHPEFDDDCCLQCDEVIIAEEINIPPSDDPDFCGCGHDSDVDTAAIVFNGETLGSISNRRIFDPIILTPKDEVIDEEESVTENDEEMDEELPCFGDPQLKVISVYQVSQDLPEDDLKNPDVVFNINGTDYIMPSLADIDLPTKEEIIAHALNSVLPDHITTKACDISIGENSIYTVLFSINVEQKKLPESFVYSKNGNDLLSTLEGVHKLEVSFNSIKGMTGLTIVEEDGMFLTDAVPEDLTTTVTGLKLEENTVLKISASSEDGKCDNKWSYTWDGSAFTE